MYNVLSVFESSMGIRKTNLTYEERTPLEHLHRGMWIFKWSVLNMELLKGRRQRRWILFHPQSLLLGLIQVSQIIRGWKRMFIYRVKNSRNMNTIKNLN
ncbi:hypothetical protein P9112_005217 [Eukaryota sp. TZLM1-RC]